jgi:methylated-DNA-[protein]-cysteine S-methyltransferase
MCAMRFPPQARQCHFNSPLGILHLVATPTELLGIWFEQQAHLPELHTVAVDDSLPLLQATAQQLQQYFSGQRQQFELPLSKRHGTSFQQAVWQALSKLGYGQTSSYQAIANAIDKPRAVRAVGAAVGRNPWTIVVPCHRVLGAKGQLTGYAGGLSRKQALLQLEHRA